MNESFLIVNVLSNSATLFELQDFIAFYVLSLRANQTQKIPTTIRQNEQKQQSEQEKKSALIHKQ